MISHGHSLKKPAHETKRNVFAQEPFRQGWEAGQDI